MMTVGDVLTGNLGKFQTQIIFFMVEKIRNSTRYLFIKNFLFNLRSLQTLISWFRHQGYAATPVPTHEQIQKCLVDIGDKERKFIGSKQWIGSTEVGYVLEKSCDVQSKFLSVSSGEELENKGRELAHHFKTHGTPIMIGEFVNYKIIKSYSLGI